MKNKYLFDLALRYLIIILISLNGLSLIYLIFKPLTINLVYYILKLFDNSVILSDNLILLDGFYAEIISACIAGSAYYLLLVLNLTTLMKIKKRLLSLSLSITIFYLINVFRIIFFIFLFENSAALFNLTHKIAWYAGSTIFLVLIWFLTVYIFKINQMPVYSDVKYLIKEFK